MDFKVYSDNVENMTFNANAVKELLFITLEEKGLLKDTAENLSSRFTVIFVNPGVLGRIWSKLRGHQEGLIVQIVEATDLVKKKLSKGNG